jgi:hypothetical protein
MPAKRELTMRQLDDLMRGEGGRQEEHKAMTVRPKTAEELAPMTTLELTESS